MSEVERPYLSLVIPAYNEERRIAASLTSVIEFLAGQPFTSELIVVDDGSTDRTAAVARQAMDENSLVPNVRSQLFSYRPNSGKGRAVRTGVVATRGDRVAFADADLATPLLEIDRALPYLEPGEDSQDGYDVVVGSRAVAGARIDRYQPLYRRLGARLFKSIRDALVPLPGISDSQCGLKVFDGELARAMFGRQRINGFMFDVETLFIAQHLGLRILELGVSWADAGDSKVRMSSGFRILPDLLRIRRMHGRLTYTDRPRRSAGLAHHPELAHPG